MQRPDLAAELRAAKESGRAQEDSALSPKRTHRVHVMRQRTPDGGCAIATYAANVTPAEEAKEARGRRLGANRERRSQAFKVLDFRLVERAYKGGTLPFKTEQRQLLPKISTRRRAWLDKKLAQHGPQLLDFNPGLHSRRLLTQTTATFLGRGRARCKAGTSACAWSTTSAQKRWRVGAGGGGRCAM